LSSAVKPGRPTDYLPHLLPSDVLYACGAPGMVESIKSIAAHVGAACYADPFLPTGDEAVAENVVSRAVGWLRVPTRSRAGRRTLGRLPDRRGGNPTQARGTAEARMKSHHHI
jgi:3-phenylpropionate/trans-cinnamate dioxygenase ferredoxin reductase subunit